MLQFISHRNQKYNDIEITRLVLEGGCRWVQLRMKDHPLSQIEETALQMKELCRSYGACLIIDDHYELALQIGANGVHLGKNDTPVPIVKASVPDDFIIGGTANTFEDIQLLVEQGVDYIGLGPYRFTSTKKNLSPILGLEGYAAIVEQCKSHGISIPMVAIGGIQESDIPLLISVSMPGIALSGEILESEDPVATTQRILQIIQP